jgi:hypothetical protein
MVFNRREKTVCMNCMNRKADMNMLLKSLLGLAIFILASNCAWARTPPGQLSGYVYLDLNNSGMREVDEMGVGEPGLFNVEMTLTWTDQDGVVKTATTRTLSNGSYSFMGLLPSVIGGGGYAIAEGVTPGYLDNPETVGTLGGVRGEDVISGIVLKSGQTGTDYNFGELPPSSVSGYNYLDSNNDGLYQRVVPNAETPIAGTTITLTGINDRQEPVNLTTTTDNNGAYSFGGLRPGTYMLTETQNQNPIAYLQGKNAVGSLGGMLGPDVDRISMIAVGPDKQGVEYNFGELLPPEDNGCTFTIGYYKNHPDAIYPLPIDLGSPGAAKSLTVDSLETAQDVLRQKVFGSPSNGITKLYAQLLAARLSILHGADESDVASIILLANDFLAEHDYQDWKKLSNSDKQTALVLHEILDNFNNGIIGPGHCD